MKATIQRIEVLLKENSSQYAALKKTLNNVDKQILRLKKTDLEPGVPNWKMDKYGNSLLRIVRPARISATGEREFVSIGAKVENIAKALASVKRSKELDYLNDRKLVIVVFMSDLRDQIQLIESELLKMVNRPIRDIDVEALNNYKADLTGGINEMDLKEIRPKRKIV
jgi:hypothetical protein